MHIGGLALIHRSLHEVGHRWRQRGDGGQGADADAGPDTAMSDREQTFMLAHSDMLCFPEQTNNDLVRVTLVDTKQPRLGFSVWSALFC